MGHYTYFTYYRLLLKSLVYYTELRRPAREPGVTILRTRMPRGGSGRP